MDKDRIDAIGEKVGKLDLTDHILSWDRKQALRTDHGDYEENVRLCKDSRGAHGAMGIHASGSTLMCCAFVKPGIPCNYREPVSR